MAAHIAVAGSVNADFVYQLLRVPRAGETLPAKSMAVHPGGKVRRGHSATTAPPPPPPLPPLKSLWLTFSVSAGRQPGGRGGTPGLPHPASGTGWPRCAGTDVSLCRHRRCAVAPAALCSSAAVPPIIAELSPSRLRGALEGCGVDTSLVREVEGPTGTAVILLEEDGEPTAEGQRLRLLRTSGACSLNDQYLCCCICWQH